MSDLFRRLGSRDAKPNPDAFWSDKWGWMDEASPADLVAVVRRGVESGTIKGEVVEGRIATYVDGSLEWLGADSGIYMVIGPVPDEGIEE